MLPLRAIPTQTLALMGMEEGVFPGVNRLQSLNAMVGEEKAEYCPTRSEYDRYLFLEVLLSARKELLISYRGSDQGEEKGPSLLVTELIHYLDSGYRIGGELPSEVLIRQHPFRRYDASYFQGDRWQTYQEDAYRLLRGRRRYHLHQHL